MRPADDSRSRESTTSAPHAVEWGIVQSMVAAATTSSSEQRESYQRRMDLAYYQVLRAHALAEHMPDVEQAAASRISTLRSAVDAESGTSAMMSISRTLALSPEQGEFVWTVVACSFDPRVVPHLEPLAGPDARQGLSVGTYAILAELDDTHTSDLATWLASGNPLVATGLLKASEYATPAARAYVASPRLAGFLRGDEPSIAPLRQVDANRQLIYDTRQTAAIENIAIVLARASAPVLVIEGPNGSGRATACACAARSRLIVLDCARTSVEHLADGSGSDPEQGRRDPERRVTSRAA